MQEQNSPIFTSYKRLEILRIKRNWTWDQLAECLSVDRSLFFHVKAGRSGLSKKVLYRLSEAERVAGITPPEDRTISTQEELQSARQDLNVMTETDRHEISILGHKIAHVTSRMNAANEELMALHGRMGKLLSKYPFGSKYNLKKSGG